MRACFKLVGLGLSFSPCKETCYVNQKSTENNNKNNENMLKATEKELIHVLNAQVRFQATSGGRLVIMLVGHKRKTRFYATTRLKKNIKTE